MSAQYDEHVQKEWERLNADYFPDSSSCHWEFENHWWSDTESNWYSDGRMHDQAVFRVGFEAGERYIWKLIRPTSREELFHAS